MKLLEQDLARLGSVFLCLFSVCLLLYVRSLCFDNNRTIQGVYSVYVLVDCLKCSLDLLKPFKLVIISENAVSCELLSDECNMAGLLSHRRSLMAFSINLRLDR